MQDHRFDSAQPSARQPEQLFRPHMLPVLHQRLVHRHLQVQLSQRQLPQPAGQVGQAYDSAAGPQARDGRRGGFRRRDALAGNAACHSPRGLPAQRAGGCQREDLRQHCHQVVQEEVLQVEAGRRRFVFLGHMQGGEETGGQYVDQLGRMCRNLEVLIV